MMFSWEGCLGLKGLCEYHKNLPEWLQQGTKSSACIPGKGQAASFWVTCFWGSLQHRTGTRVIYEWWCLHVHWAPCWCYCELFTHSSCASAYLSLKLADRTADSLTSWQFHCSVFPNLHWRKFSPRSPVFFALYSMLCIIWMLFNSAKYMGPLTKHPESQQSVPLVPFV
jgi:hypothetical protein